MTDPSGIPPSADSPPLNTGATGQVARRRGAAQSDAVPMMETHHVTAPDLERRHALETSHGRLVIAAAGFAVLFTALIGRLALITIIAPTLPHRVEKPVAQIIAEAAPKPNDVAIPNQRANILDRRGRELAISLPTVSVFADPRQIIDPVDTAHRLKRVLPRLNEERVIERLKAPDKQFVYLERQITPDEEQAINDLGIPGIDFRATMRRRYPMGRAAAQVLGGVDVDERGVAGIERQYDQRLRDDRSALRLSLDVDVQAVVRQELITAMQTFEAIGAAGMVMDVQTGELLAMVSLPDYDANLYRTATEEEKRNRGIKERYEPGSTFKLQTLSMALDANLVHIWDEFDASHPISIGRFTISDFEGKHRWLYLPEVLALLPAITSGSSGMRSRRVLVVANAAIDQDVVFPDLHDIGLEAEHQVVIGIQRRGREPVTVLVQHLFGQAGQEFQRGGEAALHFDDPVDGHIPGFECQAHDGGSPLVDCRGTMLASRKPADKPGRGGESSDDRGQCAEPGDGDAPDEDQRCHRHRLAAGQRDQLDLSAHESRPGPAPDRRDAGGACVLDRGRPVRGRAQADDPDPEHRHAGIGRFHSRLADGAERAGGADGGLSRLHAARGDHRHGGALHGTVSDGLRYSVLSGGE